MATYKIAEPAKADIDNLFTYTIHTWGEAQSEKYYLGFIKQAQLLAEMPSLGKQYKLYSDEMRVFPYEKHLIYYIEASHGITIMHVVHESKDQENHIDDMN